MLPTFRATLRTARQGWAACCGEETGSWVLQACTLRQAHHGHVSARSNFIRTATSASDTRSSSQRGTATATTVGSTSASRGSGRVRRQQQRIGKGLQQLLRANGPSPVAAAAGAAGAEAVAAPAALHLPPLAMQQPILHQPYSHFVSGQSPCKGRRAVYISRYLCTDIEEVQYVHGRCSVQVSLMSHPAGWSCNEYVQQHPVMQQLQHTVQASPSAASGTYEAVGPTQATLVRGPRNIYLTGFPAQRILQSLGCGAAPHMVILQERLSSSKQPGFLLHIMLVPADSGHTYNNSYAGSISRAGEGWGLQVFTGSVSEIAPAGRQHLSIYSLGSKCGAYIISKVLVCSQLPADITFPLKLTLTLMNGPGQQDQSSRQLGQWQVTAVWSRSQLSRSVLVSSSKLADYVGYNVAKVVLGRDPTQGVSLTLTLADTVEHP